VLAVRSKSINQSQREQEMHVSLVETARDSKFLVASLCFVLICQLVSHCTILKIDPRFPLKYGEHTWTAWAIDDFLNKRKGAAKVIFLGSSLMLTPLNTADAKFLDRNLDATEHHESCYFNELIRRKTGNNVSNFNFALPGEMPSDAFLITESLLGKEKKPKMIVYGVGPRDFMDNLLANPTTTDPYRYLSPLSSDTKGKSSFNERSWEEQLRYLIGQIFDPSEKREELSTGARLISRNFADRQLRFAKMSQTIRSLLPCYHPMEIAPGESIFKADNSLAKDRFVNSLEEYRKRYGALNWNTYLTQFYFLTKLLEQARLQHIEVVLLEMPVTSVNRKLIPSVIWNSYQANLRVLARSKGARFIDLQNSQRFTDDDFGDTVHLNTVGGTKMLEILVDNLLGEDELEKKEAVTRKEQKKIAATKYGGLE
jgi:Protein of unknown function (DUF1574)